MRFGIHLVQGVPQAQEADGKSVLGALEHAELADQVGFDYLWQGERGFGDERAAAAPEALLAAASQRTERIRLGWGVSAAADPAAIASLDLISEGRAELGFEAGEGWEGSLAAVTRTLIGEGGGVPSLRPKQDPHPPLWLACRDPESIASAARRAVGALVFTAAEPELAGEWIATYYGLLLGDECRPLGYDWNPNVAVVVPFTPDAARLGDLVRRYEVVGADQVIFAIEAGGERHGRVSAALESFAVEVMPEYAEIAEDLDDSKEEKLEQARARALSRGPQRRSTAAAPVRVPARRSSALAGLAGRLRRRRR